MAVAENPMTFGRPRIDFASEHDIQEFVDMLGKFERPLPLPDSIGSPVLSRDAAAQPAE